MFSTRLYSLTLGGCPSVMQVVVHALELLHNPHRCGSRVNKLKFHCNPMVDPALYYHDQFGLAIGPRPNQRKFAPSFEDSSRLLLLHHFDPVAISPWSTLIWASLHLWVATMGLLFSESAIAHSWGLISAIVTSLGYSLSVWGSHRPCPKIDFQVS